ncbi:TSUP family transporter [Azospirillum picis]|uniref:Probable membrane transporter protein n=1 Tax=Azospirillum picis TaxID=488438 RepID=A0ABU0MEP8_9PROT|nr:TSUP family transporter [Azospirillum picis]MBP2298071.1 putative membrane protein YfcA [Azospirillum picis]MDQ0531909.1 putative membrane protein YfcA [Azospirillum picis]
MDLLTPESLGILFAVGLLAGFVDSIAGGGGLLTIPALLAAGLSPAEALATGKLQSSFGSLSATIKFVRRGEVHPAAMRSMIACTFVGAGVGATLVQMLDPSFLRDVIPILLIGIAIYLLLSPKAGDIDAHQRIGEHAFALSIGTGIGFYDGFFGPGTGTFFAIAFVSLLGYNLRKATAHTKVLNLTSNIASLIFFIIGGHVLWTVGLLMGVAQYIGAQAGAHMVIRNGARIVRPMLVVASVVITAKLVWSDDQNILRHLFSALTSWIA